MVLGEGDEGGDSTKRVEPVGDVDEAFLVVLTGPGAGADLFRDFSDVVGDGARSDGDVGVGVEPDQDRYDSDGVGVGRVAGRGGSDYGGASSEG